VTFEVAKFPQNSTKIQNPNDHKSPLDYSSWLELHKIPFAPEVLREARYLLQKMSYALFSTGGLLPRKTPVAKILSQISGQNFSGLFKGWDRIFTGQLKDG
jgi:hypothetical protein